MSEGSEVRRLVRMLMSQQSRIESLERAVTAPQMTFSSIDDGTIVEKDAAGEVVARVGKQPDGTHGVVDYHGPTPPAPSVPLVEGGPGLLTVTWDGTLTLPRPLDLARVEAYAAEDPFEYLEEADLLGSITGRDGGRLTVARDSGTWHVALVAVSRAEKRSVLSALAEVEVLEAGDSEAVERLAKAFHTDTRPPGPEDVEGRPEGAYWTMIDETGAEAARWRLVDGEWVDAPLAPEFIPEAYADFLAANEAFVSQLTASEAFILALSVVELSLLGNLTQINPRGIFETGYGLFGDTTTPGIRFDRTDEPDAGPAGITYGSYLQVTRPGGQLGDLTDMGLVLFGPETTQDVGHSERGYLMLGKFGDINAATTTGTDGSRVRLRLAQSFDHADFSPLSAQAGLDVDGPEVLGSGSVSVAQNRWSLRAARDLEEADGDSPPPGEHATLSGGGIADGGDIRFDVSGSIIAERLNHYADLDEATDKLTYRQPWRHITPGTRVTTANPLAEWVRVQDPEFSALQKWVRVWSEGDSDTGWIDLDLINGWEPAAAAVTVGVRRTGPMAHLRGRVTGGTGIITYLPPEFRPAQQWSYMNTNQSTGTPPLTVFINHETGSLRVSGTTTDTPNIYGSWPVG